MHNPSTTEFSKLGATIGHNRNNCFLSCIFYFSAMKYAFAFVVAFSFSVNSTLLKAQAATDSILLVAEQMPEYPGGIDSLRKAVAANVTYPRLCADSGIQGRVFVRFAVNEDGSVSHVEAIKGPHPL